MSVEGSDRDDLVEALRQKAVLIRRLYRKMRDHRGEIGKPESNGQKKKRAKLEAELRDAAIRARSLGLPYEAIEEMGKPGWKP